MDNDDHDDTCRWGKRGDGGVKGLGLAVGDTAYAVIKASAVMVAKG